MANNLHSKKLLLRKHDVYAKESEVYATWRTKESGTTTCQVERSSVKRCKDAGIGSWWSAAMNWEWWRILIKESKNLYELWHQWWGRWWWWLLLWVFVHLQLSLQPDFKDILCALYLFCL